MVRQFNSWNGHVKAKFAYMCTNGCCCLRNTLLVKPCTLWDDGSTAGNSLENRFPEYLAVTFSRCVGCQKGRQIFVPSGHFLIWKEPKIKGGLSQVKIGGWSIFVMEFLARNSQTLNASCARALSWWRIHLSGQSPGLFLRTDSSNLVSTSKQHRWFTVCPCAMNS